MLKLLRFLKVKEWIYTFIVCILLGLQVYFDLTLPDYMGEIVGLIQQGKTVADIWNVGIYMLLFTIGSIICTILIGYFASIIATKLAERMRSAMFSKVNSFSMEEINNFSTSSLITRSTNDVHQVQMVVMIVLRMALSAPIMAIGAIFKIINKSSSLTITTVIAIVSLLVIMFVIYLVVVPKFAKLQTQTDTVNRLTRENLTGLKVIHSFAAESDQHEKFEKANDEYTKTDLFVSRITSILQPSMNFIFNGLALSIVWLGAYLIAQGSLSLADMTVFTQYSMQILRNFVLLSMLFVLIPRGKVSAKRINEVLNTETKIKAGTFTGNTKTHGKIEFKNVSFRYPDSEECVLNNISFTVNPGETVAFIGSTGSGKSTLINLVPRFYDATSGDIFIDDINLRDYDAKTLNAKLGYVPQKSALFKGSVEENVKYGVPLASDTELDTSLEFSESKTFVDKLENKTKYELAQSGSNLSGGQRQRLSIARAIIKSPEIFIFDDSFSALDYATDQRLRGNLKKISKKSTQLIVAQRVGTIMDADKIIVLDKGNLIACGTHAELLKTCEIYQEIAYSQLSKEELQ
ncbi:MAG: ABC transporter ATP-binding protein [Clostridia bacterium]